MLGHVSLAGLGHVRQEFAVGGICRDSRVARCPCDDAVDAPDGPHFVPVPRQEPLLSVKRFRCVWNGELLSAR
eukprot:5585345-Heterocapsa_arctica.AAC.1